MSFAAICDSKKHIYIYRQPASIDSELRNRKTGRQVAQVAKQQVISIDPPLEIMGAHATNNYIFVLTMENIHVIKINEVVNP